MDELFTIRQGNLSLHKYMNMFDDLMAYCNVQGEHNLSLFRFRSGLGLEFRLEMLPPRLLLTGLISWFLENEGYLKMSGSGKLTSQRVF